ncbi:hypothetical protein BGW42_002271 [Actinomortierella wolfii]|nr:hypothetical protein BGW42_002271 [Actinomortierella wolfii]
MQQGGDRDHSHEEQLYDEDPQPTTSTVPSPTLYSPHSPFTPRTLAHDEQSSKYNSIRSTYLSSSVPTLVTPTPFPPPTLRGMPSSVEGAGVGDQPPATDSTLKLRKKSSSSILLLSTIPETSETGKRYVNPNNRKKERKKELKLLKTLFSNERTYVHWLKLGMMMGALAMTLLNFSTLSASAALATNGDADGGNGGQLETLGAKQGESPYVAHGLFRRSPTVSTSSSPSPSPSTNSTSHSVDPEMVALAMMLGKVGQYVGAFILLVCMIFLAYATASFHWRHVGIAKWKMDGRYYDRWGPTILTILLVSAYTANIYRKLTMQATAKLGNGYQPKVFYNIHPTTSSPPPASNTIGHGGVSSRYPHASPTPVITSDDDDTTSEIEDEDTRDRYNTPTPSVFRAISGGQAEATATAAGVPNAIAGSVPTAPSRTGQDSSTPTTSETTYDDAEDDEEDGGYGDGEEDEEE